MTLEIAFALLTGPALGIIMMNVPPALTELMALYRVSYTEIALLMSALLWPHTAMQLPAGMIADRLGLRRTQVISLGCMCIGSLLPALAPLFALGIVGRMLTGVGTAMAWMATMKLLAVHAPGGRAGAYQAFFGGFFSLGSISAYLAIPIVLRAGWRWIFLIPAVICVALLAVVPMLRLPPHASAAQSVPLRRILAVRQAWLLGSYHAVAYGSMMSLGSWVPAVLAEVVRGRTATELAWAGALFMLVSGVSRLCGGIVIFRVPPPAVAHGSLVGLAALCVALAATSTPGAVLALALLAAWFGSINFGALFQLASRSVAPDSLGTFLGFVNTIGNVGAVALTIMFGWSKDALGSFAWGFAALAVLAVTTLLAGLHALGPEPKSVHPTS